MLTPEQLAEEVAEYEREIARIGEDIAQRQALQSIRGECLKELDLMIPDEVERRRLLAEARG